jgi:hypothetical protein
MKIFIVFVMSPSYGYIDTMWATKSRAEDRVNELTVSMRMCGVPFSVTIVEGLEVADAAVQEGK